jgi:hypothetical protein
MYIGTDPVKQNRGQTQKAGLSPVLLHREIQPLFNVQSVVVRSS